jgi:hypothetical protein
LFACLFIGVSSVVTLTNGDFEVDTIASTYQYLTPTGWASSCPVGACIVAVKNGDTAWGGGVAFSGTYRMGVQGTASPTHLEQTLAIPANSGVKVTFAATSRGGYPLTGFAVSYGGAALGTFTTSYAWGTYEVNIPASASAQSGTLRFAYASNQCAVGSGGNCAFFLDKIEVQEIVTPTCTKTFTYGPEPVWSIGGANTVTGFTATSFNGFSFGPVTVVDHWSSPAIENPANGVCFFDDATDEPLAKRYIAYYSPGTSITEIALFRVSIRSGQVYINSEWSMRYTAGQATTTCAQALAHWPLSNPGNVERSPPSGYAVKNVQMIVPDTCAPAAPTLVNPDFEVDVISGVQYRSLTGWTSGSAGTLLFHNGGTSGWGTLNAVSGTEYAGVQGNNAAAYIEQTLAIPANTAIKVSFSAATRPEPNFGLVGVGVSYGGVLLQTIQTTFTFVGYQVIIPASASAQSGTLRFSYANYVCTGDCTFFVDNVVVEVYTQPTVPTLVNPDFEVDVISGVQYRSLTGWTSGSAGTLLFHNGGTSGWGTLNAVSGTEYAGVQGNNAAAYIEQTLAIAANQAVKVTFSAVTRPEPNFGLVGVGVSYGGVTIQTIQTTLSWATYSVTIPASTSAQSGKLRFSYASYVCTGDCTFFIDNIVVEVAAPSAPSAVPTLAPVTTAPSAAPISPSAAPITNAPIVTPFTAAGFIDTVQQPVPSLFAFDLNLVGITGAKFSMWASSTQVSRDVTTGFCEMAPLSGYPATSSLNKYYIFWTYSFSISRMIYVRLERKVDNQVYINIIGTGNNAANKITTCAAAVYVWGESRTVKNIPVVTNYPDATHPGFALNAVGYTWSSRTPSAAPTATSNPTITMVPSVFPTIRPTMNPTIPKAVSGFVTSTWQQVLGMSVSTIDQMPIRSLFFGGTGVSAGGRNVNARVCRYPAGNPNTDTARTYIAMIRDGTKTIAVSFDIKVEFGKTYLRTTPEFTGTNYKIWNAGSTDMDVWSCETVINRWVWYIPFHQSLTAQCDTCALYGIRSVTFTDARNGYISDGVFQLNAGVVARRRLQTGTTIPPDNTLLDQGSSAALVNSVASLIGIDASFVNLKSTTQDASTGVMTVVAEYSAFLEDFPAIESGSLYDLLDLLTVTAAIKMDNGEFLASLVANSPVGSYTKQVSSASVQMSDSFMQLSDMTPGPTFLPTAVPTATPTTPCAVHYTLENQQMEGNLQLAPGSTVSAGYHLKNTPGNPVVYVQNAYVTLHYACSDNHASVGIINIPFPDASYSGNGNQPAGSKNDDVVWQASGVSIAAATATCNGGTVWVNSHTTAASFTGDFLTPNGGDDVKFQFHYGRTVDKKTKGGWSATPIVNTCRLPPTNLRRV